MKKRALFVGVDNYDEVQIRNLRYSRRDACSLGGLFSEIGYDVQCLSDPTVSEVLAAVRKQTTGLLAGDSFFFYFAGHGLRCDGQEWLLCRDANREEWHADGTGLSFEKLRQLTAVGEGCRRVFVLDTCRSNFLTATRWVEKRDLCIVTAAELVAGAHDPGSLALAVLRSCDGRPYTLEIESRQHGLWACALFDEISEARRSGSWLAFDFSFCSALEKRAAALTKEADLSSWQKIDFAKSSTGSAQVLIERREEGSQPRCNSISAPTGRVFCQSDEPPCVINPTVLSPGDEMTIMLPCDVPMTFCWCPPTTGEAWKKISGGDDFFWMGSTEAESAWADIEARHRVRLTRGFWMGKYPVTQLQWRAVTGRTPSYFKGENRPVENVSWEDCQEFVRQLNDVCHVSAALPTEAQWEFACRAGTTTPFSFGSTLNGDKANCDGTIPHGNVSEGPYRFETSKVGSYPPNAWGLYDMHGNVSEWCQDWYGAYEGDATDPKGPSSGECRVYRGGDWHARARYCRSASRGRSMPCGGYFTEGVRIVCSQPLYSGWCYDSQ